MATRVSSHVSETFWTRVIYFPTLTDFCFSHPSILPTSPSITHPPQPSPFLASHASQHAQTTFRASACSSPTRPTTGCQHETHHSSQGDRQRRECRPNTSSQGETFHIIPRPTSEVDRTGEEASSGCQGRSKEDGIGRSGDQCPSRGG